jgi:hypothetical protein
VPRGLGCEALGIDRAAARRELRGRRRLGDRAHEALEPPRSAEDEQPRRGRLDPICVRDVLGRAERLAGHERDLGSGQGKGHLPVEDVEHLVLLVVDVQRRHVPLRHEHLEHRIAPVGLLTRDPDVN